MKQTAVQWFASKVMYLKISPSEMHEFLEWFEEAKQREKMQIESAHRHGASDFILHRYKMEQYYKDTYGEDNDI